MNCCNCKTSKQNSEEIKIDKKDERTKSSFTKQAWFRSAFILPETLSHIMIFEHPKSCVVKKRYSCGFKCHAFIKLI